MNLIFMLNCTHFLETIFYGISEAVHLGKKIDVDHYFEKYNVLFLMLSYSSLLSSMGNFFFTLELRRIRNSSVQLLRTRNSSVGEDI